MIKNIEINPQFEKALHLMEQTNRNIFITGKAGTGKSTLLEYFRSITTKNIVVLAPTGVAAVNVSGQTIHSFFGFRPDVTIEKARREAGKSTLTIYQNLDAIVIDEISMVRSDLLDCVDQFMRIKGRAFGEPFGGTQLILIGDLYQIPPVVTGHEKAIFADYYESEYFFDSSVYSEINIDHLELEKIYRQTDQDFIALLNKIRNKTLMEKDLDLLNTKVISSQTILPQDAIYLTTTNAMADELNSEKLLKLPGNASVFSAAIKGEVDKKSLPAEELLRLKEDAQVMLLNNDVEGRWINGTLGRIVKIGKKSLEVQLSNGSIEEVKPFRWDVFRFYWDQDAQVVAADNVGSFKQYPLRLAWAITIHKSQGKTFDNVVIDLGRGAFASGQLYVALSRCRSLGGIYLKRAVKESDVRVDYRVVSHITGRQYALSEEKLSLDDKVAIIKDAVEKQAELQIVYLKNTDEKTERTIRPVSVGMMKYSGKNYLGLTAHCCMRQETRNFRVDRILEIKSGDTVFITEGYSLEKKPKVKATGIAGCIDVETTGLSAFSDEIVELALVLFRYDQDGIKEIVDSYSGLREPHCEISLGAQRVHGLSMEALAGQRLDLPRLTEMIERADFLIAYNASFDKGFVRRIFPQTRTKRWYCSMTGVKWSGGRALQDLLAWHGISPDQAHRALDDVEGLLALLDHKNTQGSTYFAELLSRKPLF